MRNSEMDGTLNKQQMARLRQMLEQDSLQKELDGCLRDDLEDLYDDEDDDRDHSSKGLIMDDREPPAIDEDDDDLDR